MSLQCTVSLILLWFCLEPVSAVHVTIKKGNINVPLNSNYSFLLDIRESQGSVDPIKVRLIHEINNTGVTTNQHFDFFKYLSQADLACYNYSIGNRSYLYPCPFLLNNDTVYRASYVKEVMQSDDVRFHRGLNHMHEYYVVDNTPYPYPVGSAPFQDLSLDIGIGLSFAFNSRYKIQGIRLIFLNMTILLVYSFVVAVLVCRTRRIQDELVLTAPGYNLNSLTRRASEFTQFQKEPIDEDEQYSDAENLDELPQNKTTILGTESRPSLLESSGDARLMQFLHRE